MDLDNQKLIDKIYQEVKNWSNEDKLKFIELLKNSIDDESLKQNLNNQIAKLKDSL